MNSIKKRQAILGLMTILGISLLFSFSTKKEALQNWGNWRGPANNGVAINANPPLEWSETKNVKWKVAVPGSGIGTPIVWGDQIFITTAIELDEKATEEAIKRLNKNTSNIGSMLGMLETTENFIRFEVHAIDKNTGELIWKKVVREQFPHQGVHSQGSWASASCVTDGEHMIAHFGSYGTYCFKLDGSLVWEKDLGDMDVVSGFGEGTSPAIYQDKLIIVWDHEGQSKIHVLNLKTGNEMWQKDREERTTWATPLVVDTEGKAQIVVPGKTKSIAYNLKDGEVLWELSGLGQDVIPSPVFDGKLVYLMTGFQATKVKALQAIDVNKANGNVEGSEALKWKIDKNTSYVPSPLVHNNKIYFLKGSRAQISCVNTENGSYHYEAIKPEGMRGAYASPILANGHVYFIDREGMCSVIKEGDTFELVAQNKLDDRFDASPVVVENQLFLRGHKSLYCISE